MAENGGTEAVGKTNVVEGIRFEDFHRLQGELIGLKQTQYEMQEKEHHLNLEMSKVKQQNLLLSSELKKAKSILAGIKNKDQVVAVVTQNEQLKKLVQQHKTKLQQVTDELTQTNEKNIKLQSELQSLNGGSPLSPSPSPSTSSVSGDSTSSTSSTSSFSTPSFSSSSASASSEMLLGKIKTILQQEAETEGKQGEGETPLLSKEAQILRIFEEVLETERSTSSRSLQELEEKVSTYEAQVLMWREKSNLKQNAAMRLKEENEALSKRLSEKEEITEKLRREVSRFRDELEISKTDREAIMSRLSEQSIAAEKSKDEKQNLQTQFQELQLEFDELKSTKNSQIQTLQETIIHLQNEMDKQDKDLQENKDTSQDLTNARAQAKRFEAELRQLEKSQEALKNGRKTAEDRARRAEAAQKKAEEETAVLTEALDRLRVEKEKATKQAEALQTEIKLIEQDNATVEEKQKEAASKFENLASESAEKSKVIDQRNEEIKRLQEELQQLKEELEKLKQESAAAESANKEELVRISSLLEEHKEKITTMEQEIERKTNESVAERKILERKHAIMVKELQTQLQRERAVREKLDPQGKILRTVKLPSEGSSGNLLATAGNNPSPSSSSSNPSSAASSPSFPKSPSPTPPPLEEKKDAEIETMLQELDFLARRVGELQADKFTMENKIEMLQDELSKKNRFISQGVLEKICEMHLGRTSAGMDKEKAEKIKKGIAYGQLFRSKSVADQELAADLIAKMERMLQETLLHNMQIQNDFATLGNDVGQLMEENKLLKKQISELQTKK